ncbi:hypothetical protein 20Sep420_00098 [Pseudomonas phage 20Sep420]|nr:hypothetical protein 20Sep420_00098 [Pseudomonas phage 20Sep420]
MTGFQRFYRHVIAPVEDRNNLRGMVDRAGKWRPCQSRLPVRCVA